MKTFYSFFILTLFVFQFNPSAKATHVMGSDIAWECLGNDSFLITVTVYRDCNGVPLTAGSISVQSIGCSQNVSIPTQTTMGPANDITPVCLSGCTRCSSPSCVFQYGIEERKITAIVYLGNTTCCEFRISWGQCCRSSSITTGPNDQNFYVMAEFNKCISPCNNSPKFADHPKLLLNANECVIQNHGAIDPDGDSLVYSLTTPLQSFNNSVTYAGQYTYQRPLAFVSFPNQNALFNYPNCQGFHLDRFTGELKFKPTQQQITVMAIKVEEYRNGQKISETLRDLQLIVVNTPANNEPVLSGINSTNSTLINLCPEVNSCFTVTAHDANSADSIFMNYFGDLPGASFSYVYDSSNQITATICMTPQQQQIKTTPYTFVLEVQDEACPVPGFTSRAYQVFVTNPDSISYSATPLGCGEMELSAVSHGQTATTFTWEIGPDTLIGNNIKYTFPSQGNYYFNLKAQTSGCVQNFNDDVVVPSFQTFVMTLGNDTTVCMGAPLTIIPQLPGNPNNYTYSWLNDTLTASQKNLVIQDSTQVILTVTNSDMCTYTDTINISVFPSENAQFTPFPLICENGLEYNLSLHATPLGGTWHGTGISNNHFDPQLLSPGIHWLHYDFTNSNACSDSDSVLVEIISKPVVYINSDKIKCKGDTVEINASGGISYSWSPSTGLTSTSTPLTYAFPLVSTTYTATVTDTNGCHNTSQVNVVIDTTCVWPGDVNNDGIVNNFDILDLGLMFNYMGTSRPGASTQWKAQMSDDWPLFFTNGANIKHADCDGNGLIIHSDTNVISQNYNLTHFKKTGTTAAGATDPDLYFSFNLHQSGNDETVELTVNLGDENKKATAYGIAFTMHYDQTLIESQNYSLANSWFGQVPALVWIVKDFPDLGQIDVAISRTNRNDATNWGEIIKFYHTVKNTSDTSTLLNYSFSNIRFIDKNGDEMDVNAKDNSLNIIRTSIKNRDWERKLTLYPNPANESINIKSEGLKIGNLKIVNSLGQEVFLNRTDNQTKISLNVRELASGMYFMLVETDKGTVVRKFLKE